MYVDYEYYIETYGGTISEEEFLYAERRAEAYIRELTYLNGNIFDSDLEAIRDAVCAAADVICEDMSAKKKRMVRGAPGVVKSENTDGYSVSYVTEQADGQTSEEVLRKKVYGVVHPYLLPTGWLSRKVRCGCVDQCGYHDL